MLNIPFRTLRTLTANLAVTFIAASLLAGCSSDDDQLSTDGATDLSATTPPEILSAMADATYEKLACSELVPEALLDENVLGDAAVECGFVTVPADWMLPGGDQIKLAVYKIPTTSSVPASDPLVYLEGGPGGAGVVIVSEFSVGSAAYLRERSDIYSIDQRGTGYSQPALYCNEVFKAEKEEQDDLELVDDYKACHDRLVASGVNFADYNSQNNAYDIAAIRQALSIENWDLYGLSYGTRLALTVMRDAPQGVRSVVLDSVFPPEVNGISEGDYPLYFTLDQIATNCASDADCSVNIGDLKALIEASIARLDTNPIGELTAQKFIELLTESINSTETASGIRVVAEGSELEVNALFNEIDDGANESEALSPADLPASYYPFSADGAEAMFFAVICAEEMPYLQNKAGPYVAATFSETTQRVVNDVLNESIAVYQQVCDIFNVPAAGEIETAAVGSDIPALVLAGTADVPTPPSWSMLADESLSNSQYAEFDGLTHGLIGNNDCLNTITLEFLNDPEVDADQSCILDLPRVDYVTD